MNFYKRFMGDYGRDTAHLSLAEHGAYTLLLDHYYSTESPLPPEYTTLNRICRAFDKREQDAVRSVADAFFPIGEDGLRHNHRADLVIGTDGSDGRQANANRSNGKKGGRPRKTATDSEPKNNPLGFDSDTQTEPIENLSQSQSQKLQNQRVESSTFIGRPDSGLTPVDDLPPIPDVPVSEGQWLAWMNREYGQSYSASSRFDRAKLWPIFRRWCEASVSLTQMREVIVTAQAESKTPIVHLPEYADRVLATIQARDSPSAGKPKPFDPVEYVNQHRTDPHERPHTAPIDGTAIRVA